MTVYTGTGRSCRVIASGMESKRTKKAQRDKVLAAAKKLAVAYYRYGKELEDEITDLAVAACHYWPAVEKACEEG
jgi:hypothetical protein